MNYDLSKVSMGSNGMVQTGPGQFVNSQFMSPEGYAQAVNYALNKDSQNTGVSFNKATGQTSVNGGIVSSAAPLQAVQQKNATNQAAGAMLGSSAPAPTSDPLMAMAEKYFGDTKKGNEDIANRSLQAQQLVYNASLANKNYKYSELFNELKSGYEKDIAVARNNAIALNPYSQSRGASTAANFEGAITDRYNEQARQLQYQSDLAQQSLDAGNYQAYTDIMNNITKANQSFQQNMFQFLQDSRKQSEQTRQFEVNQKNVWADNFRQQLTSIALSPEAVDAMVKDGSILNDPTFQAGIQSGYSPEGVIESMKTGSLALKKQQDLETYRQNQLILAQDRMIASQERQTKAQMALAAAQNVGNVQTQLQMQGVAFGSPQYAASVAAASRGGTQPTQQDRDRYGAMQQLSTTLTGIKNNLETLGGNNDLWNIANVYTKNPTSSEVQEFMGKLYQVTTPLAKVLYGESGRLSDDDIRRVMNSIGAGTTNTARTNLWNSLMDVVSNSTSAKLISDANAGVDVANYASLVQYVLAETSKSKLGTTTTGTNSWTSPSGTTFSIPNSIK